MNNKIKYIFLFFILLFSSNPTNALPPIIDNPPELVGTRVWGKCRSGMIATPSNVAAAAAWTATTTISTLSLLIEEVGKQVYGITKRSGQAVVTQLQNNEKTIQKNFKYFFEAQQKMNTEKEFGERAKPPSYVYNCDIKSQANMYHDSKNLNKIAIDMANAFINYNAYGQISTGTGTKINVTQTDVISKILKTQKEDITGENIFPLNNSFQNQEQIAKAFNQIQMLTPEVAVQLPVKYKDTKEGQHYEVLQKIYSARISVPSKIISEIIARKEPVIDGKQAQQMWEAMGGQGTYKGIRDKKISQDAYIDLLGDGRLLSPKWVANLYRTNSVGLLREIALMQATNLYIQKENYFMLEKILYVLAQNSLTQAEKDLKPQLRQVYKEAIRKND